MSLVEVGNWRAIMTKPILTERGARLSVWRIACACAAIVVVMVLMAAQLPLVMLGVLGVLVRTPRRREFITPVAFRDRA